MELKIYLLSFILIALLAQFISTSPEAKVGKLKRSKRAVDRIGGGNLLRKPKPLAIEDYDFDFIDENSR